MKRAVSLQSILYLTLLSGPAVDAATGTSATANDSQPFKAYGQLPLSFEMNQGQADSRVKFIARGNGYSLLLTQKQAIFVLRKSGSGTSLPAHLLPTSLVKRSPEPEREAVLRMRLIGANARAKVSGVEELPGKSNYFVGNDSRKWLTGVPNYAKVKYAQIYPGVDLVYYGNQRQLEFDFILRPGADPKAIRLSFGREAALRIDPNGDLVASAGDVQVLFHRPVIYQPQTSSHAEINGHFLLIGTHGFRFQIAGYDKNKALVIDPRLAYSSYLGGTADEAGSSVAIDTSGNAYVTGYTASSDFPLSHGAFQATFLGYAQVFVSKLNAAGSALLYSTYLGGTGGNFGNDIAIDASGRAYVTGFTSAPDFPVTGGSFKTNCTECDGHSLGEGFITKLNSLGSALIYSTYLGRASPGGIALDPSGNAYITGDTDSPDFPTTPGAFQRKYGGGGSDAFVTKLNASGKALVYSTFLGGSQFEDFLNGGIAVDASGVAYVVGDTESSDFPITSGAFQTKLGVDTSQIEPCFRPGPCFDVFVTKLNAAGSALIYSTYVGGGGDDTSRAIAFDSAGSAYIGGSTNSNNFPTTPGSLQPNCPTCQSATLGFVTKINPTGSALVYSTLLGNTNFAPVLRIAVGTSQRAYVTGSVQGPGFPVTPDAFQATFGGGFSDAFLSELNEAGSALVYSTYLGGNGDDSGLGLAITASGDAYITGGAGSNFPTTLGAFQTAFGGGTQFGGDAFVSKFSFGVPFCRFKSTLKLDADGDRDDGFKLRGMLILAKGAAIRPHTEPVTLTIAGYSVTIPPGSFVQEEDGYRFRGVINGVRLAVLLKPEEQEDDNEDHGGCEGVRVHLTAIGKGVELRGTSNPVTVRIGIGDDKGSAKVYAEFER